MSVRVSVRVRFRVGAKVKVRVSVGKDGAVSEGLCQGEGSR